MKLQQERDRFERERLAHLGPVTVDEVLDFVTVVESPAFKFEHLFLADDLLERIETETDEMGWGAFVVLYGACPTHGVLQARLLDYPAPEVRYVCALCLRHREKVIVVILGVEFVSVPTGTAWEGDEMYPDTGL